MDNIGINQEPLLGNKGLETEVLYIFVFPNFFSSEKSVLDPLMRMVSMNRCQEIFHSTFKIIEAPETVNLQNLPSSTTTFNKALTGIIKSIPTTRLSWIKESWEGFKSDNTGESVMLYKFLKEITSCVIRVMQDELKLGLQLRFSQDKDEIFMLIMCSEENLQVQADLMDYHVQLVDERLTEPYKKVAPYGEFQLADSSGVSTLEKMIYKQYNAKGECVRFAENNEKLSYFTYKDKAAILLAMINSAIDMGELIENNILVSNYCVHDSNLEDLKENWGNFLKFWKPQDFMKIRMYYGEKIAMYFAWLEYYVIWLMFPAILGLGTFIIGYLYPSDDQSEKMNLSEISILIFSMLLAIGSTALDQVWVRRQNELCWYWGTTDINEIQMQRPSYKGAYGKDPVSGQKKKIEDKEKLSFFRRWVGFSVSIMFVSLTIAIITAILTYKSLLSLYGMDMCAPLNAIQIKIMNFIYRIIAKKINDWENYEFDSEYNDSLALKLYLFQFINSYSSLFYIAFIKYYAEGNCAYDNCLTELEHQLGTIFIINICMNSVELGLPYFKSKYREYSENKRIRLLKAQGEDMNIQVSVFEQQSKLGDYETPLDDYMELIIDYGYVVMFSAAFSIVPALAFLVNVVEIRVDAFKLCNLTKRPFPAPANSIGEWQSIIATISVIGTLTNTGIIIFTTDIFDLNTTTEKWLYFMAIEHFLLIFKIILARIIPDVPPVVQKGLIWSNRIAKERIYNKVSDVDEQRQINNLTFKGDIKDPAILDPEAIEKNS